MEEMPLLNSPDFSFDPTTRPYVAGVRPFRKGSYRLEPDPNIITGKLVVHNYGHGGAGITMSWGCAQIVRDIVVRHGATGGVAVLGAGVMGLTVATLLREASINVKVYADKFTPDTTSDVAGGQWSPSIVAYNRASPAARDAYIDVLRRARRAHETRGRAYGVVPRVNYTTVKIPHLDELPTDIVPARQALRLPFKNLNRMGYKYELLLIEVPILLAKLQQDLSGLFVETHFRSPSEVARLSEKVIVNCTGLGSRSLFNDRNMAPIKGQLVRLRPQKNLEYLFSGDGYVFPRADAVIVGGTTECNVDNDTPVDAKCIEMVRWMKRIFDGKRLLFAGRPKELIRGK